VWKPEQKPAASKPSPAAAKKTPTKFGRFLHKVKRRAQWAVQKGK